MCEVVMHGCQQTTVRCWQKNMRLQRLQLLCDYLYHRANAYVAPQGVTETILCAV
jgi:hypothetical protein